MAGLRAQIAAGLVLTSLVFQSGCANGVRLISIPEGADVEVDGKKVGKAPTAAGRNVNL